MNVLNIETHLMGNGTASRELRRAVEMTGAKVDSVVIGKDDEQRIQRRFGRFARFSVAWINALLFKRLRAVRRQRHYDWVFCVTLQVLPAATWIFSDSRVVCWYDSMPWQPEFGRSDTRHWLYRRSLAAAHQMLPSSHWAERQLQHYPAAKKPPTVCYLGLDPAQWPRRNCDSIPSKPVKLLSVANNCRNKGLTDFLRYITDVYGIELFSRHFQMTIVSNDGDRELAERCRTVGVELVQGITGQTLDRLRSIYRTNDVFFLPTRKDFLPNVLIEAAMSGLPLVSTSIAGIPEIVRDGVNGFLHQPNDYPEALRRLEMFSEQPELIPRMGSASREWAVEKFSRARLIDTIRQTVVDEDS